MHLRLIRPCAATVGLTTQISLGVAVPLALNVERRGVFRLRAKCRYFETTRVILDIWSYGRVHVYSLESI